MPVPVENLRGIALAAGGFFLFAAGDAIAKLLSGTLDPIQISFARQSGLLLGVFVMLALRGPGVLRTRRPKMQILRGALGALSVTFFFVAIAHVPLADASAMTFVAPFFVTLLGALVLREPVDSRRWIAVAVGFAGTLLVLRPGLGVVHPAAGFAVLSAACFALRQLLSRLISGVDPLATTVAYSSLTASALLLAALPFVWITPPDTRTWLLLGLIAATAGLAEFLMIKALEIGNAVAVAPVQYSHIIWTTFYGWLLFAQLPDRWTIAGTLIIVATGIYAINRERLAARARAAAARQNPT